MSRRSVRLEPGCGAGWEHEAADGALGVGLDVDLDTLHAVTTRSEAALVCGDASALPFARGSVQDIVLRAVLHHLHPVETALAELARVTAADGTVTIIDGVAFPAERARCLERELIAAGRRPEPIPGFDVDELAASLVGWGFVVESIRLDGTATFATRPIVSEDYVTDRFVLEARRSSSTSK